MNVTFWRNSHSIFLRREFSIFLGMDYMLPVPEENGQNIQKLLKCTGAMEILSFGYVSSGKFPARLNRMKYFD